MIRILTERDVAWPKSVASEWFSWFDPDAGRWQKIWSPVRVSAMLLKLYLPLRTFQIRMLDSGEADSERYVDGQWVANVGVLAPSRRAVVRKGFLRKFTDRLTGRVHTGFFVNTNKTQDRSKDEDDKGYEIPWQHGDAIRVVTDLLRWQERYNPIEAPTRWADLHDAVIVRSGRSGEFAKHGAACFLFRDPCGTYRNEPLTDSRLRTFWIALLNELERRVAARGEALADGSPIVFIDKRHPKSGEPLRPVYDLHTLRVTLITALATEGGVPIPILSKCVAGHASILMTLYYVKLGVPQITEQLAEAQKKIHVEEQRNFLRFLQSAQHKKLHLVGGEQRRLRRVGAASKFPGLLGRKRQRHLPRGRFLVQQGRPETHVQHPTRRLCADARWTTELRPLPFLHHRPGVPRWPGRPLQCHRRAVGCSLGAVPRQGGGDPQAGGRTDGYGSTRDIVVPPGRAPRGSRPP